MYSFAEYLQFESRQSSVHIALYEPGEFQSLEIAVLPFCDREVEMESLIFSSDPVWSQTTKSGFRQQVFVSSLYTMVLN